VLRRSLMPILSLKPLFFFFSLRSHEAGVFREWLGHGVSATFSRRARYFSFLSPPFPSWKNRCDDVPGGLVFTLSLVRVFSSFLPRLSSLFFFFFFPFLLLSVTGPCSVRKGARSLRKMDLADS